MRTGRSLTECRSLLPGGGCLLRGVSASGGCASGGLCSQGGGVCSGVGSPPGGSYPSMHWGRPPPVNRITDTSKNITLATTSLRPVKIYLSSSWSLNTQHESERVWTGMLSQVYLFWRYYVLTAVKLVNKPNEIYDNNLNLNCVTPCVLKVYVCMVYRLIDRSGVPCCNYPSAIQHCKRYSCVTYKY